jgi:hypothetical protein
MGTQARRGDPGGRRDAGHQAKLGQLGFEPTSIPGEQFQRAVVNELTTWTEIVEKANIKPV